MESITSLNSIYNTEFINGLITYPNKNNFNLPIKPVDDDFNNEDPQTVLKDYYKEFPPRQTLEQLGQNLRKTANFLDNTLTNAVKNGYSVQDIVNIKRADTAYRANLNIFKSTFELKI